MSFTFARSYIGTTAYAFSQLPFVGLTMDSDGIFYPPASDNLHILAYPTNVSGESFQEVWLHNGL